MDKSKPKILGSFDLFDHDTLPLYSKLKRS